MSRQTRMSCSDDATKLGVGRDRRHGRRSASVFRRRRRTLRIRASRPQEACHSGACGRCTMALLMPDSRGHGESGGEMVTYGVLEAGDIRSWVDWLIAAEHLRNIFAMGESFGAAVLLQSLSVEPRFSGVVAECPFASFKAIAEYRVAQRIPIAAPLVWSGFLYARWKYGVDFHAASPEAAV